MKQRIKEKEKQAGRNKSAHAFGAAGAIGGFQKILIQEGSENSGIGYYVIAILFYNTQTISLLISFLVIHF